MTKIVKSELEHILKGNRGSPQNRLRQIYNARRRYDLTKTQKIKEETLQHCIQAVKKDHPNFVPKHDEDFFKISKPKKGPPSETTQLDERIGRIVFFNRITQPPERMRRSS